MRFKIELYAFIKIKVGWTGGTHVVFLPHLPFNTVRIPAPALVRSLLANPGPPREGGPALITRSFGPLKSLLSCAGAAHVGISVASCAVASVRRAAKIAIHADSCESEMFLRVRACVRTRRRALRFALPALR
jgi:hypothetical protein